MRVAFSILNGRIAPVFDSSKYLIILDLKNDSIAKCMEYAFLNDNLYQIVRTTMVLKINTLVCGAISKRLRIILNTMGIKTIPFISGDIKTIIQGFIDHELNHPDFLMPGCKNNNDEI
ncbi:MAG: hypothetical protein HQK75_09040 [Candidatus Magnetomorum sp.]|nr:hypothetical protein [Candidatus Magnetomorum sp.]